MNFYPVFILSTRNKSIPLITPAPVLVMMQYLAHCQVLTEK